MIRRLAVAAVLIAAVMVTLYYLALVWWLLLGSIFLLAAGREYAALTTPRPGLTAVLFLPPLVLLPWAWAYFPGQAVPFLVLAWLLVAIGSLVTAPDLKEVRVTAASSFTGLVYLGVPIALTSGFHPDAGTPPGVLTLLFVMVWASDSAAFFVGRSIGSHRPTPRLSPNKTLEGYLGALLAPAAVGAVAAPFLLAAEVEPARAAAVGLLIGLAATLGDLFESALKRGAGVKDSSSLLPGHGGVLDRIDSFLFALPAYTLVVHWVTP